MILRNIVIFILILALVWLLAGCCPPPLKPDVVKVYAPTPYSCGTPPLREKLVTLPVRWLILPVGQEQVFTLSAAEYQNLGTNVSAVILGLKQLASERDFFRSCVEKSQEPPVDPEVKTD